MTAPTLACPRCRASVTAALTATPGSMDPPQATPRCPRCRARVQLVGSEGEPGSLLREPGRVGVGRSRDAVRPTEAALQLAMGAAGVVVLACSLAPQVLLPLAVVAGMAATLVFGEDLLDRHRVTRRAYAQANALVLELQDGPRPHRTRIPAFCLQQLFVRLDQGRARLWARLHGDLEEVLVWDGDDPSRLRALELALQRALGVPERLVEGEVPWGRKVALVDPTAAVPRRRGPRTEPAGSGPGELEVQQVDLGSAGSCPVCGERPRDLAVRCPGCEVAVHRDCFAYAGCGTYGCVGTG